MEQGMEHECVRFASVAGWDGRRQGEDSVEEALLGSWLKPMRASDGWEAR